MTDPIHRFAVDAASDGKYYLLIERSAVQQLSGFAAYRYPVPFDSDAAARSHAKQRFDATDEDFAIEPGRP